MDVALKWHFFVCDDTSDLLPQLHQLRIFRLSFCLDDSHVSRLIKKVDTLFACSVAVRKDRQFWRAQVKNLIIDATEQPNELLEKKQTKYYSGKKKQRTL